MTNTEYQQLVEFLGRRFADTDQRFDAIDRRFDAVDQQFRDVLGHFDHLYQRIERLEQEYYVIVQARIEELEQRIRG